MKDKPRLSRQSLFLQFVFSNILFLLIPILVGLGLTGSVIGRYQEDIERSQLANLRQVRDVVAQTVDDLEWRIFQIAESPLLHQLLVDYRTNGNVDPLLLRQIVSYFNTFALYSGSIQSTFYLYLRNPDIIITPYSVYRHSDFQDGRSFFSMEGYSSDRWHEELLDNHQSRHVYPVRQVTIESFSNTAMLPYAQSIPIGRQASQSESEGVIVYFIGASEIERLLSNLDTPEGGRVYVADESGQILLGLGQTQLFASTARGSERSDEGFFEAEIAGKQMFVSYTTSPKQWKFVQIIPESILLEPVVVIQRTALLGLMIAFLLSVLVSGIVSYFRAKPLESMVAGLSEFFLSRRMNLRELDSGVQGLIASNRHLTGQLQRQELLYLNQMLSRLLQGSYRSQKEGVALLNALNIDSRERNSIVLVFQMGGFRELVAREIIDEMNRIKLFLKGLLRSTFGVRSLSYDSEDEHLSLVILLPEDLLPRYRSYLEEGIEEIRSALEDVYHGALLVGVSQPKQDMLRLVESHEEALQALTQLEPSKSGVCFWEEGSYQEEFYFPAELEVKLANAIRAGNPEVAGEQLELLMQKNCGSPGNLTQPRHLYYELHGIYRKLCEQLHLRLPSINSDLASLDPVEAVSELSSQLLAMAKNQERAKQSHNTNLYSAISTYLQENFRDPNLGLYKVASRFSITESYLSFFFKEQSGENFSSYLEAIRMKAASKLLRNVGEPVQEIAREVGYNNDKTFRRVFKKHVGLSPTDYRARLTQRG